jgi:hypothetical protein
VDAAGLPVTQTAVTFHTDVADAELEPATIATNDNGRGDDGDGRDDED